MSLAVVISARKPSLAPRLVAASLERSLRMLEAASDPPPPTQEAGESDEDFHVREMLYRPKEKYERLIDAHRGWHNLPALAEAATKAFIDQLWPWLVRMLVHLESDRNPGSAFKESWSLAMGLDSGDITRREHPLTASIDIAVRSFAEQSPDEFFEFLSSEGGYNSQLLQRLFCRGLRAIADRRPGAGLGFLKEDRRRFRLGSPRDRDADTRSLIAAIVPHLTVGQRAELEEAILSCHLFADDVASEKPELRFDATKWDREHRLRLLKAFPAGTLTSRAQGIVNADTLALPHYQDTQVRFESYDIHSPMSAEQMAEAEDEHITHLFEELVDQTHDNHPRDHRRGGAPSVPGVRAVRERESGAGRIDHEGIRAWHEGAPGWDRSPGARKDGLPGRGAVRSHHRARWSRLRQRGIPQLRRDYLARAAAEGTRVARQDL